MAIDSERPSLIGESELDRMRDSCDRLRSVNADLLNSLKAILGDIDSGLLVRDITRDGEPGWSKNMLEFVQRLQAAQIAIAKAEGR